MKKSFQTNGTCNRGFDLEVENGIVKHVEFTSGCDGNLKAICNLVEGRPVKEVVEKIRGIKCGSKTTSCPDQLAKALEEMA